jgi:hypothetical protein
MQSKYPVFAKVTKVYPNTPDSETNSVEVDVVTRDQQQKLPRLPVISQHNGHIWVPQVGEQVEVTFLDGRDINGYVTQATHTEQSTSPLARAGHWRHEFQRKRGTPFYIEAEQKDHSAGEPNTARFAIKEGGFGDPVARIELDRSGRDPIIRLTRGKEEKSETDMGLVLNLGTGGFKIGDGSQFGIESDGSGNFTWYANSVDFKTDGSTLTFDDSGGGSGGA